MKPQVALIDVSEVRKDLTIEIDAAEVKAEFEKTFEAYARQAHVPGFRPGKLPRNMLKQRFGREIEEQVFSRLMSHALEHALQDHKLNMVGEPGVEDVKYEEGTPLSFKVSVEVIPPFELGEYKGIKATKRVQQVTDDEVETVVNQWREKMAKQVKVEDRPSQTGDLVAVNLVGKYIVAADAPAEEDLKADDVQIELGAEGVQAEFNEHLTGVQEGDVREFRVVYPAEFTSQGLAGKTLDFTATISGVYHKEMPAADDEFARQFGPDYDSIEKLRERVRVELRQAAEHEAMHRLRDELMDKLLAAHPFPVPDVLVDQRARERVNQLIRQLAANGMPEATLKQINWEDQVEPARAQAADDVRLMLLIGRIGYTEQIRVSSQEVDAEIARMAPSTGLLPQQLKARLTKDEQLPSIENQLRSAKTIDLIAHHADITVEEVTATQLAAEAAARQAATAAATENQPAEQA